MIPKLPSWPETLQALALVVNLRLGLQQMRMKNKMKDSKTKFEEWWEVVKEYFTKALENNMVQHRANERIMKYKLKVYQKKFPIFICGNPTNTKVLGQDEKTEARPSGTA